jgi:hypothetical protein
MANSFTVPVEGANVKAGVAYVKTADGGVAPASGQPTTTGQPGASINAGVTGQTGQGATATPETQQPAKDLTLIEQFHPSLDPAKVTMSWDEKTGRVRIAPIEAAADEGVEAEGEADTGSDLPDLGQQHQTIPGGSQAGQTTQTGQGADVVADLRGQIGQLTQIVTAIAQAQLSGKGLDEVLGLQQQKPVEPDYSNLDLYDPAQLAGFIKQTVGAAITGAMAPHQQTMEGARRRQEYDAVALKFSHEPDFHQKSVAAIQLVAEQPALTIEQAYGIVNKISQTIAPKQPATTSTAATQQPAAQQATRTITAEQAAQKAEQAKRLPGNSGVKGAGKPEMPAHITGLGQMIAWNLQEASRGNA